MNLSAMILPLNFDVLHMNFLYAVIPFSVLEFIIQFPCYRAAQTPQRLSVVLASSFRDSHQIHEGSRSARGAITRLRLRGQSLGCACTC